MEYDNVGLLVGDPENTVTKILTCLDVTEDVIEEAIEKGCELIVAHHPLIFGKIGSINPTNQQGKCIYKLIQNNLNLLVAHTNLDAALDGVSFVLANMLGLDNLRFLNKDYNISRKISLTTTFEDREAVLQLMNYYSAEDAHFFEVDGRKDGVTCYEAIIDRHNVHTLERALKEANMLKDGHYQVTSLTSPSNNFGMGVLGEYPDEGIAPNEFLHLVSQALEVQAIRYSGEAEQIKKVAVCGGSGVSLKRTAINAGADAFVTADIKYHDYFTEEENFLLVDVGHYESEFPVAEALRKELSEAFEETEVYVTGVVTNPMKTYIPDLKNLNIQSS
jgi:dinuclear metal center YbgI/SA1388 family protein